MYVHDISSIVWEILRPAAVQGGDHQFGLPERIGASFSCSYGDPAKVSIT